MITKRPAQPTQQKTKILSIIYQKDQEGTKEGAKMMFRGDEGELEESLLFY